jgi:hypothetical protein
MPPINPRMRKAGNPRKSKLCARPDRMMPRREIEQISSVNSAKTRLQVDDRDRSTSELFCLCERIVLQNWRLAERVTRTSIARACFVVTHRRMKVNEFVEAVGKGNEIIQNGIAA